MANDVITIEEFTTGHEVVLADLDPESTYFYRVQSADRAGNGPTTGQEQSFTTGVLSCFVFSVEPSVVETGADAATVTWATSKVTRGSVRFSREGEERVVSSHPGSQWCAGAVTDNRPYVAYARALRGVRRCRISRASRPKNCSHSKAKGLATKIDE